MKIQITEAQMVANPALNSKVTAKTFNKMLWNPEDFTHAEIKWCLANATAMEEIILYSPVLTQAQLNAAVPVTWPDSTITVDEVTRQKTWAEYAQYFARTGGFCIHYSSSPKDENDNVLGHATFDQLKAWVAKFLPVGNDGFLTKAEFDALAPVEVP